MSAYYVINLVIKGLGDCTR